MARTSITPTSLGGGDTTDPDGATIDAALVASGAVINNADPSRTVLRVTNSGTDAKKLTVRAGGEDGPAWMRTQGDYEVSVPADGTHWVGPLSEARYSQHGGKVHIDFEDGFTGTITAFQVAPGDLMGDREYIGAGGMRLHLREPLDPLMAAQVARGELRPADGEEPVLDGGRDVEPQVVQHGADAPAAVRVGRNVPSAPSRPAADARAGEWATYAVRLGLLATKAATMSRQQLVEWVEAYEAAGRAGVGDTGEGVKGPEHASVAGRPNAAAEEAAEEEAEAEGDSVPERPAKAGPKAAWVAYVVALGASRAEAESLTKDQLVAKADELERSKGGE